MDYTAILKLIETRFNVPALTQRDATRRRHDGLFRFHSAKHADRSELADTANEWHLQPDAGVISEPGAVNSGEHARSAERRGKEKKASANMVRRGCATEQESEAKTLEGRYLFFFFFAAFFLVAIRHSSF
jgi:hypothetical protein